MLICDQKWREAMTGSLSLYDKHGERLHTIYVGAAPEYGKKTFSFAGLCGMQRGRTDVAHTLAKTKALERSRRLSRLLGAITPRNSLRSSQPPEGSQFRYSPGTIAPVPSPQPRLEHNFWPFTSLMLMS
jgi:hypothetical protein